MTRAWKSNNPEKVKACVRKRKSIHLAYMKDQYAKNPELFRKRSRKSYQRNKEKEKVRTNNWRKKNQEKYNNFPSVKNKLENEKFQRKFVKKYRVKTQLRNAISRIISGRSGRRTLSIIGLSSLGEFIEKMDSICENSKWHEDGYHLDHIWQMHWFDFENHDPSELCSVINHWSNLRPYPPESNLTRKRLDFDPLKKEDFDKYKKFLKEDVALMIIEYFNL